MTPRGWISGPRAGPNRLPEASWGVLGARSAWTRCWRRKSSASAVVGTRLGPLLGSSWGPLGGSVALFWWFSPPPGGGAGEVIWGVFGRSGPRAWKNSFSLIFLCFLCNYSKLFPPLLALLAVRPAALGRLKNDEKVVVVTGYPCSALLARTTQRKRNSERKRGKIGQQIRPKKRALGDLRKS